MNPFNEDHDTDRCSEPSNPWPPICVNLSEPYGSRYAEFLAKTLETKGYDFHHPHVLTNIPPPTVKFPRALHWWSWDRPQRLKQIMRLRDQLVETILALGDRIGQGRAMHFPAKQQGLKGHEDCKDRHYPKRSAVLPQQPHQQRDQSAKPPARWVA
jgi:hypothetical protein